MYWLINDHPGANTNSFHANAPNLDGFSQLITTIVWWVDPQLCLVWFVQTSYLIISCRRWTSFMIPAPGLHHVDVSVCESSKYKWPLLIWLKVEGDKNETNMLSFATLLAQRVSQRHESSHFNMLLWWSGDGVRGRRRGPRRSLSLTHAHTLST